MCGCHGRANDNDTYGINKILALDIGIQIYNVTFL